MATIKQLLSILPTNKSNAIHASRLATQLSLPTEGNQVETRQLIRDAIHQGFTIVSNTRLGYWLSSDKLEIQEYIQSLESRAQDTKYRAQELKDAWNKINPTNLI